MVPNSNKDFFYHLYCEGLELLVYQIPCKYYFSVNQINEHPKTPINMNKYIKITLPSPTEFYFLYSLLQNFY